MGLKFVHRVLLPSLPPPPPPSLPHFSNSTKIVPPRAAPNKGIQWPFPCQVQKVHSPKLSRALKDCWDTWSILLCGHSCRRARNGGKPVLILTFECNRLSIRPGGEFKMTYWKTKTDFAWPKTPPSGLWTSVCLAWMRLSSRAPRPRLACFHIAKRTGINKLVSVDEAPEKLPWSALEGLDPHTQLPRRHWTCWKLLVGRADEPTKYLELTRRKSIQRAAEKIDLFYSARTGENPILFQPGGSDKNFSQQER